MNDANPIFEVVGRGKGLGPMILENVEIVVRDMDAWIKFQQGAPDGSSINHCVIRMDLDRLRLLPTKGEG